MKTFGSFAFSAALVGGIRFVPLMVLPGTYEYSDGSRYSGEWATGRRHGQGERLLWPALADMGGLTWAGCANARPLNSADRFTATVHAMANPQ